MWIGFKSETLIFFKNGRAPPRIFDVSDLADMMKGEANADTTLLHTLVAISWTSRVAGAWGSQEGVGVIIGTA